MWRTLCWGRTTMILLQLFIVTTQRLRWLALSRTSSLALSSHVPLQPSRCEILQGSLVRQQVRFCKDHPLFMDSVKRGAIWAIDECQFQFRTRRWNCSTLNDNALLAITTKIKKSYPKLPEDLVMGKNHNDPTPIVHRYNTEAKRPYPTSAEHQRSYQEITKSRKTKKLPKKKMQKKKKSKGPVGPFPVVPQGTRESSFVHAISSAGVAHAITRRCSSGELDDCGCDRSVRGKTKEGFQWSGCSDNVAYGVSLSKRFVDARDRKIYNNINTGKRKKRSAASRALVNLHNNEVGRNLVEGNMKVECKCHGVSGSCELKTCWKAMPTFREIGELLKDKFDGATEVRLKQLNGRLELEPNKQYFKKPTEEDLVYVQGSPEYCEYDIGSGSLGTHGRKCDKNSRGLDGCDLLCCNRGFTSRRERVRERCSCKFHWCCFVQCRTCIRDVVIHTCK
ncbi:unnamed protein product, partial [Meganyctiphanes norvegica]